MHLEELKLLRPGFLQDKVDLQVEVLDAVDTRVPDFRSDVHGFVAQVAVGREVEMCYYSHRSYAEGTTR